MIFGLGGNNRRPTRDELEQEAADTIAELVAAGRPPPEVWRKAEEWRAANPPTGTSWYTADDIDDPSSRSEPPTPTVSPELKGRAVRLPSGALKPSKVRKGPQPTPATTSFALRER